MERDMHIELTKLIEAIDCNHHETKIIHRMVEQHGFNQKAIKIIRKTVRSEVARKIDHYLYMSSVVAELSYE